jgi:hypothetical protein
VLVLSRRRFSVPLDSASVSLDIVPAVRRSPTDLGELAKLFDPEHAAVRLTAREEKVTVGNVQDVTGL